MSARRHSSTRRPFRAAQLLVVALSAIVGLGPIASSRHELTVRHVVCAEHGELTDLDAPTSTSRELAVVPVRSFSSVEGQPTAVLDGHEHCASGFTVRQRAHLSIVISFVRFTPPPAVVRAVGAPPTSPGRAVVLAGAPKTSPPATV